MCGGVRYTIKNETLRVFFPNPNARLPVVMRDGNVSLLPRGRRKEQAGNLPLGGWARLKPRKRSGHRNETVKSAVDKGFYWIFWLYS